MRCAAEQALNDHFWARVSPVLDGRADHDCHSHHHGYSGESGVRQKGGPGAWGGENLFDERTVTET